ncbi:H(+)/Cl(-) exchange transporter ClcA [Streptococcus parauberis]|uniref:chloride channel protein n=1 Tax=Streptococcus parauberis TaxID=1348 RepID=UPI000CCEE8BF|nr:chloride channel protein [Streptococcus parauberis]PNY21623.1 H(+)/Cl(-) exchange transporter ClcA [Streptococcus parauberis]
MLKAKLLSIKDSLILVVLALGIGLVVGALDFVFGSVLLLVSDFRTEHLTILLPFLAGAGLLTVFLYHKFGGKASKGMSLIFLVSQGKEKEIPLVLIPLIMFSTWMTHLFGGSAGREGVAVQLGATVSHYCHSWLKVENSSRIFLAIGMAAGFAGLFQTPLAAIFFAFEVLAMTHFAFFALFIPVAVAAYTASTISHALGLEKFSFIIKETVALSPIMIGKLVLLGLIFGLAGNLFAYTLGKAKTFFSEKLSNPYQKVLVLGIVVTVLVFVLHSGRYSGLGTNLINMSFSGETIYSYDWFLKVMLTVLTIAAGYQGGEVTPLFSIGASLGALIAPLFGLPVSLVAALGYSAVFASATNTYLASVFIGYEVFGSENMISFLIVVLIATLLNQKHSIYANQELLEVKNKFQI